MLAFVVHDVIKFKSFAKNLSRLVDPKQTIKLGWPYSPILPPHSPEKQSIREAIEHLLQVVGKVTRHSSLVLCPGMSNESGMKS